MGELPTLVYEARGFTNAKWRRAKGMVSIKANGLVFEVVETSVASAIGNGLLPPENGRWRNCPYSFKLDPFNDAALEEG